MVYEKFKTVELVIFSLKDLGFFEDLKTGFLRYLGDSKSPMIMRNLENKRILFYRRSSQVKISQASELFQGYFSTRNRTVFLLQKNVKL